MTNPKYFINIVYVPIQMNGQELKKVNGFTQSMPTYSNDFFVASMPELSIAATGSNYTTALSNLLAKVVDTPSNGYDPINNTNLL